MFRRILYVENGLGLGGATRCLQAMVRAALERNCQPCVAVSYHDPQLKLLLDPDHLLDISPFRRLGATSHPPDDDARLPARLGRKFAGSARHLLNALAKDAPLTRFLQSQIKTRRIELVHTNNGLLTNRAEIRAASRAAVPLIAHQRGWEWPCALNRALARQPARIVTISDAVRRNLLSMGAPPQSLTRIYDGVNLEQFTDSGRRQAAAREQFGLDQKVLVVGLVATHLAWKGHDLYLQALARLCPKTEHLRGLVVGSRPAHAEPLSPGPQDLARRLGIADRIVWSRHLPDPAPAYAACDIVVHASKHPEPFGLVVVEAMACGRPVVAPDAGGPAETVSHGRTGLLYARGEAAALADALHTLVTRPQLRHRLGRAARLRATELFDEQKALGLLFDLYEETAAAPPVPATCPEPWP